MRKFILIALAGYLYQKFVAQKPADAASSTPRRY